MSPALISRLMVFAHVGMGLANDFFFALRIRAALMGASVRAICQKGRSPPELSKAKSLLLLQMLISEPFGSLNNFLQKTPWRFSRFPYYSIRRSRPMTQSKKAELILAVDVGASLTKAVYSYVTEGGIERKEGFKAACSAVRKLTKSTYASLLKTADDNSSLVVFEDSYWLVGVAARGATLSLSATQTKAETAIVKSLAILGQLLLELRGRGFEDIHVTFGILLPIDEWGDNRTLSERLEKALWEFEFNGITLQPGGLKGIYISPEGYGVSRLIQVETGGVFIFGHRDVSWLHLDSGSVSTSKSKTFAGYGMHRLIQEIDFTFKDELQAAAILFAAGESLKEKYLLQLVDQTELPRLKEAITEAREQIWLDLTSEFKSTTYRVAEQILCSGGNAYYWQSSIKDLLGRRFDSGTALYQEVNERFPNLRRSPLKFRGADVYAFARTLPNFPLFEAERYNYV